MRPINKKLDQWVEVGLLQAEQAKAISDFENSDPQKHWAILGIAGLGIAAFVSGLISLIAGNWETISVTSKIVAYFMIQLGLGALFLSARDHNGPAREVTLTCFSVFFLGGIFLTRQIYSLNVALWQMLLFWNLLVLPPTFLARNRLTYHFWIGGLCIAVISYLFSVRATAPQYLPAAFMCTVAFINLLFAAGAFRFQQFRLPEGLRHATVTWSVFLLLCGITPIANGLWYQESTRSVLDKLPSFAAYTIIPWVACTLACLSLALSRPRYHQWFRHYAMAMLILISLFLTVPLLFEVGEQKAIGCLGFILIWTAAAIAAGFNRWKWLFDLSTFIIAVRFIMVYLESFHGDSDTGIGLMLSGMLIFCVAFIWHRYRGKVEAWLAARS